MLASAPERATRTSRSQRKPRRDALRMDDLPTAALHQRMSLALGVQLGLPIMIAYSMIVAAPHGGEPTSMSTAARLHARVGPCSRNRASSCSKTIDREIERWHRDALEHLGADTFVKECAEGRAMSAGGRRQNRGGGLQQRPGPRGIQFRSGDRGWAWPKDRKHCVTELGKPSRVPADGRRGRAAQLLCDPGTNSRMPPRP